jgi:hypothetical protein
MADEKQPDPSQKPLQFDVAETETSESAARDSAACRSCSRPIVGAYYQVNDTIICEACREELVAPRGSRSRRVLRAIGFGALAAVGGSILYFAVAALTDREFAIVAIAVGYMVGIAVRKGSRGRGGWAYQAIAVGLTYLAIVTSYVPLVAKSFQRTPPVKAAPAPSTNPAPIADTITISASGPEIGRAIDSAAAARRQLDTLSVTQAGSARTTKAAPVRATHISFGTLLLGMGALVLIAAAVPIIAGFSNIIGLLIIGIALFQAWQLNRRVTLRITGPYRLGARAGGPDTVG